MEEYFNTVSLEFFKSLSGNPYGLPTILYTCASSVPNKPVEQRTELFSSKKGTL